MKKSELINEIENLKERSKKLDGSKGNIADTVYREFDTEFNKMEIENGCVTKTGHKIWITNRTKKQLELTYNSLIILSKKYGF